ncbi:T9SS type A sorting domain-containing protein [Taibaiella lutea]|uniref:T9SS type A sorting domain-containing protein n=1 Tax=Taibaiella lutea TaxID=2608001 RepID=A0A5M6CEP4_9BACT|nr:T9SS type A sorting domain-containing protein [Taibaiella lutea]KAA5532372.1 T9SS type A sorting domain-containing protein [Taibaiella lutea]
MTSLNLQLKPKVLLSRPLYWCLILLLAFSGNAFGQFAPVPVTGFNADIVADGATGTTPGASSTAAVDGATGYVFVTPTFGFSGTPCSNYTTANALPASKQITSTNTTTNTGITYTLQDYGNGAATNNNALRIPIGGTGSLTLVTPINAAKLYLVSLGGNGASTYNVTITYSDGSSETVVNPSGGTPDWCGGAATYKLTPQQYYRINRTLTACTGDAGLCQYIYEVPVPVGGANFAKNIVSLSFSNVASGILNIMAVGMQAPCTAPPAPTGITFNASTTSTVSGSFTASTATGYLVVRYPAGSTPVTPVGGTTYVPGAPLGTGKIVSMGTTTTFSASALSANTSYDVYVYGYNTGTTCGGPVFGSPLIGTQSTTACGAPTLGTVTAGVRTITVGPTGDATTITAALADINTNGLNTPTILELQTAYVSTAETFPITFPSSPCVGSVNTLKLRPAAGANGLVIAGSNAGPTIDLNGAAYVTIDGRPGGVGSSISFTAAGSLNTTNLNITNTNAAGSAIKLGNGASNNMIQYCDLQGQSTVSAASSTTIGGVVYMDNTGSTGNDNNTISYCNIHSTSASAFPAMGIYSLGTNVTTGYALTSNDNNTVDNSNVYDYFNATSGTNSAGIELNYGNNAWIITNNSFFQTDIRAITGAYNRAVWVIPYRAAGNVGNGFNISNNYIGGSQPQCGGSPYTLTTSGYFDGIRIEMADGATPAASIIQNNTIRNISITSSTTSDLFHGIATAGGTGLVSILDNTIGTATGTGGATTGGVTLTTSASAVAGHAILLTGTGTYTVQNNKIANFTIPSANSYFTGIFTNGNIGATINNNTIGSLTDPQSIYFSDASTSSTTGRYIRGISLSPTGALPFTVTNNTIAGIWSNNAFTSSSGQVVGIFITTTTANFVGGVTGNVVKNLYTAARTTGTTTTSALMGICASSTSANVFNVSGNTVDSLICTGTTGAINIIGLYFAGSTSVNNTITRNFIHTITAPSTNTAVIYGILNNTGTSTFANNMVRLGVNPDGTSYTIPASIIGISSVPTNNNNFYNNSVYIGGTGVDVTATNTFAFRRTGTSGTYNVVNNIFVNNRSNATTGGTHYAMYFTTSNTGATVNNNLYNATGTGGVFAYSGTANVAAYAPGWIASDGLSVSGDPQFLVPNGTASSVNLHLNTTVASLAESHAVAVSGITNDFDGDSRSGYSGSASGSAPDIGADEYAGIYINLNCSGMPAAGTATSSVPSICPNLSFTLGLSPVILLQGISYQWQSSPASANTWTNIGTAQTSPVYTTSITASTDFRCVVTCTSSNLSDTSIAVNVAVNSFDNCYCTETRTGTDRGITLFQTTGAQVNLNKTSTSTGTTNAGYSNYTTTDTIKAISGFTVNFNGTVGPNDLGVKIFVDWNHDGDFTDANETMYNSNSYIIPSFSGSFVVPSVALPGYTRMRIKADYNSTSPTVCGSISSGESEDYAFVVIPLTVCAGAPNPGNTNASTTSICATGSTNLSVDNNYLTYAGINYQWQSSPDGINWSNIVGATTATATASAITQSTSYRLRMICLSGPDTAYSTPVQVVVHTLPTVTVTPSQAAFCTSGSATLLAGGASTYTWTPSSTLNASTGATVIATPTTITTYTVVGTDIYNCSNSAIATVGPIDAFTPVGTATGSCAPNLPVTITATPIATAVGSMEYMLTDTLGAVIGNWQAGTNFTVTPTVSGSYKYYLFARNTTCNTNISDTGTVIFYDGFGATVTVNNATCANGDGSLIVSGVQGPGTGNPTAVWYSNDFASSTLNSIYAVLQGGASITSNYLQLTPNANSSNGGILIKNPNAISRIDSVGFDLSIPQSGGADGMSWSYGDITYPAAPASYPFESGIGNKLIISFDAYGTSGAGIQGVYLTYGQSNVTGGTTVAVTNTVTSTMLAYSPNASWTGASNTHVNIYISSDNKLTLKMGATTIFNAVQLPAAYGSADKSAWQQILAARTGGISEQHAIDNLGIYYNTTSYSYGASPANSGTVPSTWQTSSLFSGLSGGDSLDIWVANPASPATCNKFLGTYNITSPVMASMLDAANPSCVGAEDGYVLLKVNAAGTYNVSYKKNGGATITQNALVSSNDGTNEYIAVILGQGAYTNFKVVNTVGLCVSNTIAGTTTLTAPAATAVPVASTTSGAMNQPGAGTQYYTDASCDLIAAVTSANNLGTVTANVTVGTPAATPGGEPFVGRYVDIVPSQNANLPATLKLYFTTADFTAYNNAAYVGTTSYPAILPDNSNLRIRAFHGLPSSGTTGPNGTYDATNSDILLPTSVVWNTNGFWEVTVYSPNGFSGFFANTTIGSPLNITIGKIAAHNEGAVNIVNWDTKTESANDRFIIERSSDARTFTAIGTMDGKGNAPSDYSFTDTKPFNSINYYRLILMNADGSRQYSNVVSAEVKNVNTFRLNVFPNPASTEVSVSVSDVIGKGQVELTDITGRVLVSQSISNSTTISLSLNGLADGIYIVKYHDDANVQTVKINKK